ncbi:flagellar biosynthesis protein FlhF [Agarivorans sp. 1_MG-2023]|uniref:flagellar biosynthesis protein FlhF n=1 Tax=Agarivorans sp. 1_MG-2023 TaxID=3062634 RepID=UPI0026E17373|nr:flagellar biosynthesis protein FlhF [Agarivorans sp. 1_MG-2023]MDO6764755.1 flagellar biosynthesis protein FlhF [Agarivorans sp. 1_MG-2023]
MKRFFAKDMRTALAEVKETLGSDAVIMSNKKVTGGIEIVAAVEPSNLKNSAAESSRELAEDSVKLSSRNPAAAKKAPTNQHPGHDFDENASLKDNLTNFMQRHQKRQQENLQQSTLKQQQQSQRPRTVQAPRSLAQQQGWVQQGSLSSQPAQSRSAQQPKQDSAGNEVGELKKEMAAMRKLLEHQVSGLMWQEVERQEPVRAMLIKQLQLVGFDEDMADQIAGYIPEELGVQEGWQHLRELLANQLPVGQDEILLKGGAIALLGPTGVGKTTTIAKLAAQFSMRHGADSVAMITTDTYRIGAHEQLATYGKIMGCAVRVANDEEELSQLLYQFKDKKLVLIDTAGMSQRDLRLHEQLDKLVKNSRVNIRNYLVMSANAQRRVIEETVNQFQRIPLAGTILTKLDESLALGEVLNVTLRHALPISYVTHGQQVPEDIAVAEPTKLIEQALSVIDTQSRQHFWFSETEQQKVSDVF